MDNVNFFVVFIEGILSFFSPCILPILPVYLSILSNSNIETLKSGSDKFVKTSLFRNTILFVLGISTTFFLLGSSINVLTTFFNSNKDLIMLVGGILIVIMGLFYIGIIKSDLLSREKRFNMQVKDMNPLAAFLLGFTFSFGWTPCIGPILASVLIMASTSSSSATAMLLILVYTVGFILPFIIVSAFYSRLFNKIDKMKNYMDLIKKIGGIILIASGLFMLVNGAMNINSRMNQDNDNVIEKNQSEDSSEEESADKKVKAIDFTLKDQYGNEHAFSEYEGKTIFLNFWATWCPPCRGEMPHIEELYKEYGNNSEDVVILGVASPNLGKEGSEEHITQFLNENGYTFPVVFDVGGDLVYKYGINAFPTTFIIDKEGYVKLYVPGAMNKETMKEIIEEGM